MQGSWTGSALGNISLHHSLPRWCFGQTCHEQSANCPSSSQKAAARIISQACCLKSRYAALVAEAPAMLPNGSVNSSLLFSSCQQDIFLTWLCMTGSGILGGVHARPGRPSLRGWGQRGLWHISHRRHIQSDQSRGLLTQCKGSCSSWL